MIQKINHFSITVKDVNQVVAFFRDVFGLTNVWPTYEFKGQFVESVTGMANAHLRITKITVGQVILEFIQYLSPRGRAPKLHTNDIGCPHIAFEVDDIEKTYKALDQRGVKFKGPPALITVKGNPMYGLKTLYLWGPENITLELMQLPK